eukprot:11417429-Alexandrium_andersonii.AAC.1
MAALRRRRPPAQRGGTAWRRRRNPMPSGMHFRRCAEAGPGSARADRMPSGRQFPALRRGRPGFVAGGSRCRAGDASGVTPRQAWCAEASPGVCHGRSVEWSGLETRVAAHRRGASWRSCPQECRRYTCARCLMCGYARHRVT